MNVNYITRFLTTLLRAVVAPFRLPKKIVLKLGVRRPMRLHRTSFYRNTHTVTMCNIMRLKLGADAAGDEHIVNEISHRSEDKVWDAAVSVAVDCLINGGVVAVPTDTIYGIACLAQNDAAVERVYAIKGRDPLKPIAICVAEVKDVYKWGEVTISDELLRSLLPGPVTVLFQRTSTLNPLLNPGTALVGIRVPDSGFVRDICRLCSGPLALTSANISSQPSSLSIQGFKDIWGRLDHIFDGGYIGTSPDSSCGSTVVDLSVLGTYSVVRTGSAYSETVATLRKHGLQEDLQRGAT